MNVRSTLTTATRLVSRPARRCLASQSTAGSPTTTPEVPENNPVDRLSPNVLAAYLEPARKPSRYGIPSCQLQLRSYDIPSLTFFADFAMRAAFHLDLPARGPVPMPKKTERWTVPRGPFVHKKTQENFERITHKRMIKIMDGHPQVVERWLSYLNSNAMPGVGLKANTYSFDSIGVGARMQQAKTEAALEGEPQEEREVPNLAAQKAKKLLAKDEFQAAPQAKETPAIEKPKEDA